MADKGILIVGLGGSLTDHSAQPGRASHRPRCGRARGRKNASLRHQCARPSHGARPAFRSPRRRPVQLGDATHAAHGLNLASSPLYHGTVSGAFKNALDSAAAAVRSREPADPTNKVVGLMSTAGGVQGLQAVNTMEFVVRALRGWAVPMVVPIPQAFQHPSTKRVR